MKRHPTNKDNPAPTQTNTPLKSGDLAEPENLILVAQKHCATGCPKKMPAGYPALSVI